MQPSLTNNPLQNCKAMSTYTKDLSDLSFIDKPNKHPHKSHCTLSLGRYYNSNNKTKKLTHNNTKQNPDHENSFQSSASSVSSKPDNYVNNTPISQTTYQLLVLSASLELILAKFNELDAIKTHLNTIDNRLDHLQSQPNVTSLVAQRF